MATASRKLDDLFLNTLKDIYCAEEQALKWWRACLSGHRARPTWFVSPSSLKQVVKYKMRYRANRAQWKTGLLSILARIEWAGGLFPSRRRIKPPCPTYRLQIYDRAQREDVHAVRAGFGAPSMGLGRYDKRYL